MINEGGHVAGVVLAVVMLVGLLASAYLSRGAFAAREGDPLEFTCQADRRSNSALALMIACTAIGAVVVLMGGVR